MALTKITEIRKQEILNAFYQTACEEGLESTSLAKIAKVLDVQPSLIVHYFKSKEDLLLALIDFCLDKYFLIFENEFSKPGLPDKKIHDLINRLFSKEWNQLFDDGLFYSCYALTFRSEIIREKFRILHERLRKRFSELIKDFLADKPDNQGNPELLSHQIFTLIDGAYYYINMQDSKEEQESHLQLARSLAYRVLGLE